MGNFAPLHEGIVFTVARTTGVVTIRQGHHTVHLDETDLRHLTAAVEERPAIPGDWTIGPTGDVKLAPRTLRLREADLRRMLAAIEQRRADQLGVDAAGGL